MKNLTETSEKIVQKRILDWLNHEEIFAWRNNSGLLFIQGRRVQLGAPGSPDIIGIMPDGSGRFFGIEVKGAKGKQNDNQLAFEQKVKQWNGVYIVARSLDEARIALLGRPALDKTNLNDFLARMRAADDLEAA